MMTQQSVNWRKLALSTGIGAVAGAAGMIGLLWFAGPLIEGQGLGAVALAGVGLVYLLMGAVVGFGVIAPTAGAKVLNVAGPEDLIDQARMLSGSATTCVVLGLALLLLPLAGPAGPVPAELAAVGIVFALTFAALMGYLQARQYDEMWRRLSADCGAAALALLAPALVIWATLARFGWSDPLDPLGVIALVFGLVLIAAFAAVWQRGLIILS